MCEPVLQVLDRDCVISSSGTNTNPNTTWSAQSCRYFLARPMCQREPSCCDLSKVRLHKVLFDRACMIGDREVRAHLVCSPRAGPITSARYGVQLRNLLPAAQTLVGSAHFLLYTTVVDWPTGAQLCSSIGGALAYFDTTLQ